jgi:hypothetical protein
MISRRTDRSQGVELMHVSDATLRVSKPAPDRRAVARWAGRRQELPEDLREALDEPAGSVGQTAASSRH